MIFDIREHEVFSRYEFAQSPQLLKVGEINRIYFSSRLRDFQNFPESRILYVDYDSDFRRVINYCEEPVLHESDVGSYDEHGIFPIHPHKGKDGVLRAYLSGWSRRISVPVETAVGVAESSDGGKTFQRLGQGPILCANPSEPFLVGDPFLWEADLDTYMFYIAGKSWSLFQTEDSPQRVYKIRGAKSKDGLTWERLNQDLIQDSLGPNECQALPSLSRWQDRFLMAFCYRHPDDFRKNEKRGYRLGFAESYDLENWIRVDREIQTEKSNWDSEMQCYPHLFSTEGKLRILYNGNQFGKHGFGMLTEA